MAESTGVGRCCLLLPAEFYRVVRAAVLLSRQLILEAVNHGYIFKTQMQSPCVHRDFSPCS